MVKILTEYKDLHAVAQTASFKTTDGRDEHHIMLHVAPTAGSFSEQECCLRKAEQRLLDTEELQGCSIIFKRYFLSDIANQAPLIQKDDRCAVSLIQQPPLDGSKIAVWIYLQENAEVERHGCDSIIRSNGYEHIWSMGMAHCPGNSFTQTETLLVNYSDTLARHNADMAENCVRTWFFVRDVDTQYKGLVNARKEIFYKHNLNEQTHYISSTGIGGVPEERDSIVRLDAYALKGFEPEQQRYLYAPTHLNPTHEYGVTFERGTLVEYGDRGQIFISGTASINNKGEVVHVGDIVNQTKRMWENVDTLLKEGGADFNDVMQIIVYLRDIADYDVVKEMFDKQFPDIPKVITNAPVCRPQWLIEMECMAVTERNLPQYRKF